MVATLLRVFKLLVVDALNRDIVARIGDQWCPWCCAAAVNIQAKVNVGRYPDCLVCDERPALTERWRCSLLRAEAALRP
jgi:hypothetical protein